MRTKKKQRVPARVKGAAVQKKMWENNADGQF